jgi:hypothetical protein
MDIQMPDMDGYQATALIRADERHADLPIIAMTAHAVAGYRERCLEMDMNDYVTKPIDPDTLYAVLATWVTPDLAARGRAGAAAPAAAAFRPRPPGIDMHAALERLGGHDALLSQLLACSRTTLNPVCNRFKMQSTPANCYARPIWCTASAARRVIFLQTNFLKRQPRWKTASERNRPRCRFTACIRASLRSCHGQRAREAAAPAGNRADYLAIC